MWDRLFSFKAMAAPTVTLGSLAVTPIARSITLTWRNGGLVVAWPSAVMVSKDGRISRVGVVNATRRAQALIIAVAGLGVYGLLNRSGSRKERLP